MKNIEYFRKYELNQPQHLRGDVYEGYDRINQDQTIVFLDTLTPFTELTTFEDNKLYPGYIYCLYGLPASSSFNQIDKRMFDFGNYALKIYNPNEFINRVKNYSKENNLFPNCNYVKYYDELTKDGLLNPFMKRSKYSYQSEVRIYIHSSNPKEELILNIGSLKDIATIVKC